MDLHALESILIKNLMDVLDLFDGWLNNGFYSFHTLPIGVKKEIPERIVMIIRERAEKSK